ncbi:MAG: proton-conducting membrane transporter [Blautia sp.]|nr:proton-conducting membrane transporter [Blautia sp.]
MLQIIAFLFPLIAGPVCAYTDRSGGKISSGRYAAVMLITDLLGIAALMNRGSITLFRMTDKADMTFCLDDFGRIVLAVVLLLYTAVCFYAFEYMKMEERPHVFFGFYFVSLGALMAVCMSANLVTLYFCFELATLSSVPLVLHEMTKDAVNAGLKYLFYSVAGALMGLLAVFFVYFYTEGSARFVMGGFLSPERLAGHEGVFLAVIFTGIIGFGTKAGMYPMHGWLPSAHPIAPAPASALLSGIIAKAGIVAVVRLVYYSVGAPFLRGTWVQYAWMCLAMLTILMGSTCAFREKVMKKRLAYSTVSQISYIMLALSLLSEEGLTGGILHLLSHAASKGCLFLVAGIFIYKLGFRKVSDLKGIGKRMPVTMWCFMIASLSLVGIPPMGGFTSKWVIAGAAIGDGMGVFSILPPVVLLISALLTAGYLFPIAIDAFFPGEDFDGPSDSCEPSALMTVPLMVLCLAALVTGVFGTGIVNMLSL